MADVTQELITEALSTVNDPEIKRPITELGMVDTVTIGETEIVVRLLLTVAGCPLKDTLTRDVTAAVVKVAPAHTVRVDMGVMTDEQRKAMQEHLRGGRAEREIPFAQPGSLTKVYAIASGKGGVGKSSVTVNLAVAMAKRGLKVGIVDADIYGHSIPDMLGVGDQRPTQVEDMIMPVPTQIGDVSLKVMSIGMLKPRKDQVVAWRGPMLDRALVQMLADVYWGDLDALFLDLPPGTGDMAISLGQHLPNAEVVVVTTPQQAAAEVAERAGSIALQTRQRIAGVVENMSWLELPDGTRMDVFGSGGGQAVSERLTRAVGAQVPLLGQIPLDPAIREAGDAGTPIVLSAPDSPAGIALREIAEKLAVRRRGLAGMSLGIDTTRHL